MRKRGEAMWYQHIACADVVTMLQGGKITKLFRYSQACDSAREEKSVREQIKKIVFQQSE